MYVHHVSQFVRLPPGLGRPSSQRRETAEGDWGISSRAPFSVQTLDLMPNEARRASPRGVGREPLFFRLGNNGHIQQDDEHSTRGMDIDEWLERRSTAPFSLGLLAQPGREADAEPREGSNVVLFFHLLQYRSLLRMASAVAESRARKSLFSRARGKRLPL